MIERNEKMGKPVPKRREKKCCDKPKGEEKLLPSMGWVFPPPKNLDTTVKTLTRTFERPVCMDEMGTFVIPTVSIF